ncbi:MAG: serine--tRNA ligase [bacterium (Candidatus Ratteibacteria) CG01_land_8_20_14_3_00_40_19]|uniref:Serine--tRNA ligase n=2 Tax=Candidatus Ratteibacteria TaxID=2979319 RepID=A0A2M7E7N1_9BACT|nr:MAG: serine--tRNA ligase [bacterium (Candidatus Ratteibacteria) CG01_land_8_20_14_3_00_40_19]
MLSLKFIRENPERVKKAIKSKVLEIDLEKLLSLDREQRALLQKSESLREEKNKASAEIAQRKKEKKASASLIEQMKRVAEKIKEISSSLDEKEKELNNFLLLLPNVPHSSVPPEKNLIVSTIGKIPEFDFEVLPHWEIGKRLDILDFKTASRMTGAAFPLYKGLGAKLERALINFMLDTHQKQGYQEISPPFIVNRASMKNCGQLPWLEEDMYHLQKDDFFLIPTAEVPLTNIHQDEILPEEQLPIYYTAYSPCFRREAGAYGRQTKGLLRVHQFDKVELLKLTKPETSYEELEKLRENAEKILQLLKLPYRVVLLSSKELSFAGAKCYDLEVWAPAQKQYLEVSSCSNFEDFQARRAKIRYHSQKGTFFVHTLNGSGIALPRTVVAILENYQQKDGSVIVPEVLRPYLNEIEVIK